MHRLKCNPARSRISTEKSRRERREASRRENKPGRLNRVLTKLSVHKSIPFEAGPRLEGVGELALLIAQIPICRGARDTYARGAVISNRRFSKVASATLLVKGSVIAR